MGPETVSVRTSDDLVRRLNAAAAALSTGLAVVSRAAVTVEALRRGVEILAAEAPGERPRTTGARPTVTTSVRMPPDLVSRLDAVAVALSTPLAKVSRAAVIGGALLRGVEALEGEVGQYAWARPEEA